MKTSELYGAALDRAVAAATEKQYGENRVVKVCRQEATMPAWIERENWPGSAPHVHRFSPSTNPAQGLPIIEREKISIEWREDVGFAHWVSYRNTGSDDDSGCSGPTPLVAAMRCYAASQLGYEVSLPEELS